MVLVKNLIVGALGCLLFVFLFSVVPPFSFADVANEVSFTVGPEETVWSSNINYIPDQGYYVFKSGGELYGVIGGSSSAFDSAGRKHGNFLVEGDPIGRVITASSLVGMGGTGAGERGNFDEDARWLASVWEDADGILHGFYHAERVWNKENQGKKDRNSTGYAVSRDGGRSWTLPNYPKNEVIRGKDLYGGDLRVIPAGEYLYMYYQESESNIPGSKSLVALARSRKADKGKPGSWFKYYCSSPGNCGFTESGLGGNFTPLNVKDTPGAFFVVRNEYLGKFIAFGAGGFWRGDFLEMLGSDDGISWHLMNKASVARPSDGWGRIYVGIVSREYRSSETTGREFWLYYVGRQAGPSDPRQRYLYRRKITLNKEGKKGDANGDGVVDATDYQAWKEGYLTCTLTSGCGKDKGNFNLDSKVDGLDFAIWAFNYGK